MRARCDKKRAELIRKTNIAIDICMGAGAGGGEGWPPHRRHRVSPSPSH